MFRIAFTAFAAAAWILGSAAAGPLDEQVKQSVSATEFGVDWPLIVPSGEVACRNQGEAIFIYKDKAYALNGTAKRDTTVKDIGVISKPHPTFPDVEMDSTPLREVALDLCSISSQ